MNDNKIKFGIAAAIIVAVIATSVPLLSGAQVGKTDSAHSQQQQESKVVRIGYFPNINHAQAVIGLGRGDFQKALGSNVEVKTQVFNAGPSAIEALFAKQVDITYIGPNPAINGYVKSDGQGLRIVSGAASGGAVFVVRNDSGIQTPADFAGKKFASPQLGNTQDVALRRYLLENGYKTKENGGNVEVIPATNADILTLFLKKEIDVAWVPEPWGAKLVKEANGRIFLDERDRWPGGQFVTAHIIVSTDYLKNNLDVVKKVIEANVDETKWINDHPDEALKVYNEELKKLTGKTLPEDEYKAATSRLTLTYDPAKDSLFKSASDAYDIGFLKEKPNLSDIYDLTLLNEVLKEKGLPQIS
jgi:NitT/TauT family transport system substrate-binding protein